MMFDLGYVKPEEIPGIPRLQKTPKAIVYAPLAETPADPDLVLFALKPSAAMRLQEAPPAPERAQALLLWAGPPAWPFPLPRCTAQSPASAASETASTQSSARTKYIWPSDLAKTVDQLQVIGGANAALGDYARSRREQLSTE
jgi:hypothetical protein